MVDKAVLAFDYVLLVILFRLHIYFSAQVVEEADLRPTDYPF